MGESPDSGRDKAVTDLTRLPLERSTPLLDEVSEINARFQGRTSALLESAVENSKLARYALVTVEGLAYAVPGSVNAVYHNLSNLPELGFKVGAAATIGVGLRLLLPQKGAARALVGTTMGYFFVKDALHPFMEAYSAVSEAKDIKTVHQAARKMGDGAGLFLVDSFIGIKVGKMAEAGTGWALKRTLGPADYLAFEGRKEIFWNSDKHVWGRGLNAVARQADKVFGGMAEKLMPKRQTRQLPLEEALKRVQDAGERAQRNFDDGGFYKYGPKAPDGKNRLGFSDYIDGLLSGKTQAELAAESARPAGPDSKVLVPDSKVLVARHGIVVPDSKLVLPDVPRLVETNPAQLLPVTGQAALEYDAANLAKLAAQAKRVQGTWTEEAIQLADIKEGFQSPVFSLSDATRRGALLGPEYNASAAQLQGLAGQIRNVKDLENAGFVLDMHGKSALQHQLKMPSVLEINLLAEELHGIFMSGLRKAGVSDGVLKGRVPSRVAITNDGGGGNFTIPNIDGVIDRPITVVPRNQTGLLSVFAGINRHEQIGHDHVYGDLARFPAELRMKLIGQAVENAMRDAKIPDVEMNIAGMGTVKKSDLLKQLLIAQANENTADIVGTATGAADTALTLGILLQSLRKGGLLETRNVYGSKFADGIEPHGIDRWRVKLAAEVIRQQANGDKDLLNTANALDNYAAKASRVTKDPAVADKAAAEDVYVWASQDQPGQYFALPTREWDAIIPHIVKAQLDTPLEALEGRTFRAILPQLPEIAKKIDTQADLMANSVQSGSRTLTVPFDKSEFTIGQVFAAGLRGWMKSTARGEDPAKSLDLINSISESLRAQYREGNPHAVALTPSALKEVTTKPLKVLADITGRTLKSQTDLREASARYATHMGSAASYLMIEDLMKYHRLKKQMEAGASK